MMEITLFWVPCQVCQWRCLIELMDETTINLHTQGELMSTQAGCLAALHGEQSITALSRCGKLVLR